MGSTVGCFPDAVVLRESVGLKTKELTDAEDLASEHQQVYHREVA